MELCSVSHANVSRRRYQVKLMEWESKKVRWEGEVEAYIQPGVRERLRRAGGSMFQDVSSAELSRTARRPTIVRTRGSGLVISNLLARRCGEEA